MLHDHFKRKFVCYSGGRKEELPKSFMELGRQTFEFCLKRHFEKLKTKKMSVLNKDLKAES